MKKVIGKQIANGIFRITDANYDGKQTLTERYDIVKAAVEEATDGATFDAETGVLKAGDLTLKFDFRPDDDNKFWSDASKYLLDKFEDYKLNSTVAEGNPNSRSAPPRTGTPDMTLGLYEPGHHFGISVEVGDKERFYGLGEGSSNKLELRGRAYQNWTFYQYNEIPVPFFMSSGGWGMLINANARHFVDICEQYNDKVIVSGEDDHLDVFVFYGNYQEILKGYTKLTGKSMVLPGWAYGLTYVAPINTNQFELLHDAERFRGEKVPVDMFSIEPGWMTQFYDFSTETQWNMERFHMPEWYQSRTTTGSFVAALRRKGIHTSLWFCESYDLTDEAERVYRGDDKNQYEPWYKHLGIQTEYGIDGFKLDPADHVWTCHPELTYVNGVPQLHMHNLNQVLLTKQVYEGTAEKLGTRPMHHYCGGYIGTQKWSAFNTGDNGGQHRAMCWLLTLAMTGLSNSTIDMYVYKPESIHFGFFVPWAHYNSWTGMTQPWYADEHLYEMFKFYDRLRYRLYPYIYSAALEAHDEALPMIRPMPLAFPEFEPTFDCVTQYMFGPSIMVCAYGDTVTLPEGKWEDYWTGKIYEGNQTIPAVFPKHTGGALFVKRGAIIPCAGTEHQCIRDYDKSIIELDIYPEGDTEYILREDDMISLEYENTEACKTVITCSAKANETVVTISAPDKDYEGRPEKRTFKLNVYGGSNNVKVVLENKLDSYSVNFTARD